VRTNLSSSILRGDGISDSVRVLLLSILRQRGEVGERSKVVVLDPKDMSNCPAEELELDPSRLRTKNEQKNTRTISFSKSRLSPRSSAELFCSDHNRQTKNKALLTKRSIINVST